MGTNLGFASGGSVLHSVWGAGARRQCGEERRGREGERVVQLDGARPTLAGARRGRPEGGGRVATSMQAAAHGCCRSLSAGFLAARIVTRIVAAIGLVTRVVAAGFVAAAIAPSLAIPASLVTPSLAVPASLGARRVPAIRGGGAATVSGGGVARRAAAGGGAGTQGGQLALHPLAVFGVEHGGPEIRRVRLGAARKEAGGQQLGPASQECWAVAPQASLLALCQPPPSRWCSKQLMN